MSRDRQLAIFGHEVTRAREAKDWSKAELARRMGVRPSAVSQWESGEHGISEERLIALERVLDKQGELGWIVGMGTAPDKAKASVEAAIEADDDLSDELKDFMLGGIAGARRGAEKRRKKP